MSLHSESTLSRLEGAEETELPSTILSPQIIPFQKALWLSLEFKNVLVLASLALHSLRTIQVFNAWCSKLHLYCKVQHRIWFLNFCLIYLKDRERLPFFWLTSQMTTITWSELHRSKELET